MDGFVIDVCDLITGEIADQVRVSEKVRDTLARELGVEDIARGVSYDIDSASMARLALLLEIDGVDGRAGRLRVRGWFDELPYKLHTGRELTMMLAGEKPLAVFCDDMPDVKNNGIVPTELFEPYVASGVMVRRARTSVTAGIRCRDVFYALATEAWRIDAYLLLIEVAKRSGWSAPLERMQGRLLGYSDEENDAYIDAVARQRGW